MKTYIKPSIETFAPKPEAMLATSIPVGNPGVNPGDALVPEFSGIIDDEDSDEL